MTRQGSRNTQRSRRANPLLLLVVALACSKSLPPPTASLSAPATAHLRVAIQLDGTQSLPAAVANAPPIVFAWTFTARPPQSTARFSDPTSPRPRFTPDAAGTYGVQLVVTDLAHSSAPAKAAIVVSADCTPLVAASAATPAQLNVGQPAALSAAPTSPCDGLVDVGSDPLVRYGWSIFSAPAGSAARIAAPDRLATFFTPDVRGDYDLQVRVSDALGFSSDTTAAAAHVHLTALACGDNLPVVQSLSATPAAPGLGAPVQLSAVASDDDAVRCGLSRTLTESWSMVSLPPGSRAHLDNPGAQTPSFTPDQPGDYLISLVVSDELGRRSSRGTLLVTASACGGAVPVVTVTGPASAASNQAVQLVAQVADADTACGLAPSFSYAWRVASAPLGSSARLNDSRLSNPTFAADAPGTYLLSLVVASSNGKSSAPVLTTLTVAACGSVQPIAVIAPVAGGPTGVPLRFVAAPVDANAACATVAPYRYQWTLIAVPTNSKARLGGALASGISTEAAPSLLPDVDGVYTVQLTVSDALGLTSAPAQASATVSRCNAPLLLTPSTAGGSTGQLVVLNAGASDPNDPLVNAACATQVAPFLYDWAIIGAPTGSAAVLDNAHASAPSFVPDLAGSYTARVQVSDAAGNRSAPATVTVNASPCNAPLSVSIAPASGNTGLPVALAVGTLSDPNTGPTCTTTTPLSYAWSLVGLPQGSAASLNNPLSPAPSFVPDVGGAYLLQLLVTDAAGTTSNVASATVVAATCNAPLTASITTPAGVSTGAPVSLSAKLGDLNDPAGSTCTVTTQPYLYSWSLTGRPAGSSAALNAAVSATPSFTPDLPGPYSLSLSVADQAGNRSNVATANLVASPCNAPLTPAIALLAGGTTTLAATKLSVTPGDPNDPSLGGSCPAITGYSYAWTLLAAPAGSTATLDTPLSSNLQLVPDKAGSYVVAVRVTDSQGNAGSASRTLTISGCGSGGAVIAAASASPLAPQLRQTTILSVAVTDSNGPGCGAPTTGPFSYNWTLTPTPLSRVTLSSTSAAQPSFKPDVAGAYSFSVTITDALGFQASASNAVTALDCTLTPSIATAALPVRDYSATQVTGSVSRAAGCANPFTVAWSFDSIPAGSKAAFDNRAALVPSFTVDVPSSTWAVHLTAIDSTTGARTSATANVTSDSCGSQPPYATTGISLPFPIAATVPQPNPAVGATVQYLPNYQLQLDGSLSQDNSAACTGLLAYHWSTYLRPPSSLARLHPTDAAKPVFSPDVAGDYVFQLSVSDGRFTSPPSFLHITVSDPLQDFVDTTAGVLWNDAVPEPSTGNPSIAYYQLNAGTNSYDLIYTHCTANCATAAPTWVTQTIEADLLPTNQTLNATAQVSMKYLPNGNPAVAYRDTTTCEVKYGVLNNGAWNTSAIAVIVDQPSNGCDIHGEVDLVFVGVSQTPAVSFHSHRGATQARYAVCTAGCNTGVGTAWTQQLIDGGNNNNAGHYITSFVDPVTKNPRVAWHKENDFSLHYATCSGSCDQATGTWKVGVVELPAGTSTGLWNSMAINGAGVPSIAYETQANGGTGNVRLATCTANCGNAATATWSFQDVNTAPLANGNYFPHLRFDALNQAHIAYIDIANQTLRYAIQNGSANSFQFFDIDHGVDDGHSSFILTVNGSTHVSYALKTGLKYYPFGN